MFQFWFGAKNDAEQAAAERKPILSSTLKPTPRQIAPLPIPDVPSPRYQNESKEQRRKKLMNWRKDPSDSDRVNNLNPRAGIKSTNLKKGAKGTTVANEKTPLIHVDLNDFYGLQSRDFDEVMVPSPQKYLDKKTGKREPIMVPAKHHLKDWKGTGFGSVQP